MTSELIEQMYAYGKNVYSKDTSRSDVMAKIMGIIKIQYVGSGNKVIFHTSCNLKTMVVQNKKR